MAATNRNRQMPTQEDGDVADQPEGDDAALASAGLIQHENDSETARNR